MQVESHLPPAQGTSTMLVQGPPFPGYKGSPTRYLETSGKKKIKKIKTSYWQVVPENIATGTSALRDPSVKKTRRGRGKSQWQTQSRAARGLKRTWVWGPAPVR